MTDEKTYDMNMILFTQLLMSFQASAMQQMGKILNPFTQKIERDLSQAKMSIDMLAMIEEKTRGNLGREESTFLERILFELRMNYVDEVEKEKKKAAEETQEKKMEAGESADGDEAAAEEEDDTDSTPDVRVKDETTTEMEKAGSDGDDPVAETGEREGKPSEKQKAETNRESTSAAKRKTKAKSKSHSKRKTKSQSDET